MSDTFHEGSFYHEAYKIKILCNFGCRYSIEVFEDFGTSEVPKFQVLLTLKLVMLLALLSAQHVQTLHLLSVDCMVKDSFSYNFEIAEGC